MTTGGKNVSKPEQIDDEGIFNTSVDWLKERVFDNEAPELDEDDQKLAEETLDEYKEGKHRYLKKSLGIGLFLGGAALVGFPLLKWAKAKMTETKEDDVTFPFLKLVAGLTLAGIGISDPVSLYEKCKDKFDLGTSYEDAKNAISSLAKGDIEGARQAVMRSKIPEVNEFQIEHSTVPRELLIDIENDDYEAFVNSTLWRTGKSWVYKGLNIFGIDFKGSKWAAVGFENQFKYAAEEKSLAEILKNEVDEEPKVDIDGKTVGEVILAIQQRNKRKGVMPIDDEPSLAA